MKKAFWKHFKHFGRLLAKIYLFLTPSKTDGRVPSYNLQPDLLGSFPADVCPDISASFGCGHRAKFSPYIKSNPVRHHELSISLQHFPSKDILLVPSLPASKNLKSLRNGSIGCPCKGPKTWVQCQFFRAGKCGFLVKRNLTDVHPNLNISRKKKKEKRAWYSGYEPRRTKILHNTPASYFFENLCLWLKSI